jgi:hypothetical protein
MLYKRNVAGIALLVLIEMSQPLRFDRLFQFKLAAIERHKPQKAWKRLELDPSFRLDRETAGVFFKSAIGIEKVGDKFYIVDNLRQEVVVVRTNGNLETKIGQAGHGPGEFLFPRALDFYQNRFYIVSNLGIDVFGENLLFEKRLRTFLNITNIRLFESYIYCNTLDRYRGHYPLVLKLNLSGQVKQFYYDDSIEKSPLRGDKCGHILILNGTIIFVPINWNQIYFLDRDLNLMRKTWLEYSLLKELENWNDSKSSLSNPNTVWFCNMIAAAKNFGDKIFILLNIPRLEILEISMDGNIVRHYYNNQDFLYMRWNDFTIEKNGNELRFHVLGRSIGKEKSSPDFEIYRLTSAFDQNMP